METRNNFLIKCHIKKSYLRFGVLTRATKSQHFGLQSRYNEEFKLTIVQSGDVLQGCQVDNVKMSEISQQCALNYIGCTWHLHRFCEPSTII